MIYFVGTPIGNLEEITLRALNVLKNSDVIFCEDTRHSAKLVNHYSLTAPLKSYHKFNEAKTAEYIISLSANGKNVSIISDAGMPCISDPGATLIKECIKAREAYTVISGACAFVNAFIMSGFEIPFTFVGFLPQKNTDRDKLIERVINGGALIFYSAPHDINDDLQYLYNALGDRKVAVVKELTKIYENVNFFDLKNAQIENPRGEYVIVVDKIPLSNALNALSTKQHVDFYIDKGMTKMQAIKETAKDLGVTKNEIYKQLL